jgi:hypothetical protein
MLGSPDGKLRRWQQTTSSETLNHPGGFHTALAKCLQALQQGDAHQFQLLTDSMTTGKQST